MYNSVSNEQFDECMHRLFNDAGDEEVEWYAALFCFLLRDSDTTVAGEFHSSLMEELVDYLRSQGKVVVVSVPEQEVARFLGDESPEERAQQLYRCLRHSNTTAGSMIRMASPLKIPQSADAEEFISTVS
jgi:hypothetical protein